jgi:hypothetical protein
MKGTQRMSVRPLAGVAIVVTSLALAASTLPATAAAGVLAPRSAGKVAADWQASQLTKGVIHNGEFDFDDWGLTIDTAFALAATGNEPRALRRTTRAITHHYFDAYATFSGDAFAGAMAKSLLAAKVLGKNARHFGGHNVRGAVLDLVAPATEGFEAGRVRDSGATDLSNTFAQAYAVLGLARTGGVRQSVVDYLRKQQCAEGFFRLTEVAGENCNQTAGSNPDVDATALALQGLVAADRAGSDVPARALRKATRWLAGAQRDSGGFKGGTSTPGVNTNSTGLAAQALKLAGRDRAVAKAAGFVAKLQLTRARAHGRSERDIGAIAYDRAGLKDGLRHGISVKERDQFRRATAQAIFALVPKPLTTLKAR